MVDRHGKNGKRITPACAGKTPSTAFCHAGRADHPRVCGENLIYTAYRALSSGSPPRVRGKLQHSFECAHVYRITPACAGKTCRFLPASSSCADHPRVCGENWRRSRRPTSRDGSPPRVRGKRCADGALRRPRRITPACAGKTRG